MSSLQDKTDKVVKFGEWNCKVQTHKYNNNGRVALVLVDANNGEYIATATINVPEIDLAPDEVIVKDYSENEGLLACLLRARVVKLSGRYVNHGFCKSPICVVCI